MTPEVESILHHCRIRYWTPYPTSKYLGPHCAGKEADYNLYYILRGRPLGQRKGEMLQFAAVYRQAHAINARSFKGHSIGSYVTLLTPEEFYEQVILHNVGMFVEHYPVNVWKKLLYEKDPKHKGVSR